MSSNYWNQQQNNDRSAEHNRAHGTSNLVQEPRLQPQPVPLQSPPNRPTSLPHSPTPQISFPQQQAWPSAQSWPSAPPQLSPAPSPSLFASTVDMMRRVSGKIAATRPLVDQEPLVLYRPTVPPPPKKRKPWKRSHSVRVAMQMRHRRMRLKHAQPKLQNYLIGVGIAFCLLIVIFVSSGSAAAYAYYQSQLPQLQGIASQQINQTTRIYDRNGKLLYEAYDDKTGRRTPVSYKYIPKVMQDAMIATEDHTFWDNSGIDPQGILRAATDYVQSNSVQGGGSTITQQLIKNLTGNDQVTLQRKLPEAALAIGLTQQYPKWKILEMYFNVSPFGAQEAGLEAAVEDYFHLKPKCDQHFNCIPAIAFLDIDSHGKHDPLLALARASLLAGMPQNPVTYDPTISPASKKMALGRQQEVLGEMLSLNMHIDLGLGDQHKDMGPITQDVVNKVEAMTAKMHFTQYNRPYSAPHFVEWVRDQVISALGNGDMQLGTHLFLTGGFNIRTTIDSNLETFVENNVRHHLRDPEYQIFVGDNGPLNTVHNVNDSAVVVMNAKTGEVLAMDGSTDWNDSDIRVAGKVNAALSPRQPGSSFKPILYATAFQMGWYPGIVLPDKQTYFPNGQPQSAPLTSFYHPSDYGGNSTTAHYSGLNSNIRIAISNSFNVPAVKTIEYTGTENVLTMARRLGITSIDDYDIVQYNKDNHTHLSVEGILGPSMALGTLDVPLLQMVGAYQVFANHGSRVPPQGVLDIWDNYGYHIYHFDPAHPQSIQVLSPQIAFLVTSIISDENARAYEFEQDHVLSMWDWQAVDGQEHDVAAKTGTTDSFQDNWTLGYTSDVVVGVWSGNANGEKMDNVVGITGAAPIWHDVIEYVSGRCLYGSCSDIKFPTDNFVPPPGLTQQTVSSVNGLAGAGDTDWMLQGEEPQQSGLGH